MTERLRQGLGMVLLCVRVWLLCAFCSSVGWFLWARRLSGSWVDVLLCLSLYVSVCLGLPTLASITADTTSHTTYSNGSVRIILRSNQYGEELLYASALSPQ